MHGNRSALKHPSQPGQAHHRRSAIRAELSGSDTTCAALLARDGFNIEHVVTADDPFGEPWPPDGACSVMRRAQGFTLWRRFSFKSSSVTPGAASPGTTTASRSDRAGGCHGSSY